MANWRTKPYISIIGSLGVRRKIFFLVGSTHVAKMASHAIFQYNVLAIDDTHNTWTNICVKMIIIRLIGPRGEKIQNPEEIRSKGPRQR